MTCNTTLTDWGMEGIADLLVYPTSCDYFFWAKILGGLFILFAILIYFSEKKILAKPDMISSMGVSSLAVFVLALIGTMIESTGGYPMVQQDIFIYVFAFTIIFVGIWIFKD